MRQPVGRFEALECFLDADIDLLDRERKPVRIIHDEALHLGVFLGALFLIAHGQGVIDKLIDVFVFYVAPVDVAFGMEGAAQRIIRT